MTTLERIRNLIANELAAVDARISHSFVNRSKLIKLVCEHIILSGGKRLRPMLVILGAKACGYQGDEYINLAAALEFFHTATLLHDDVVDQSNMRRGKKTANELWGNKASVLVGDFLFTLSFQLMLSVSKVAVLQILADTSNTITEGEVKQLQNCHDPEISIENYMQVIRSKTAVLFAAASKIGAVLADKSVREIEAMHNYGMHLGTAFQLIDDALDYSVGSHELGKNMGDDLAEGKPTLPLLHILRTGNDAQKALIRQAIQQGDISQLGAIQIAIADTGAVEYTKQQAKSEIDLAITQLQAIADSDHKQALIDLAYFAVERDH